MLKKVVKLLYWPIVLVGIIFLGYVLLIEPPTFLSSLKLDTRTIIYASLLGVLPSVSIEMWKLLLVWIKSPILTFEKKGVIIERMERCITHILRVYVKNEGNSVAERCRAYLICFENKQRFKRWALCFGDDYTPEVDIMPGERIAINVVAYSGKAYYGVAFTCLRRNLSLIHI